MANPYYDRNLAVLGGFDLMKNKSYDNFMDAKLGGLLKQMQQTNNFVQENNLMDIGVEERKREEEKLARMKALREFGERMEILAQRRSGNPQIAAALQQQMDARKLAEQQRIEAAQKQQRLNAIYESLPPEQQRMMDMYNAGVPKDVVESYFKKPEASERKYEKARDGFYRYIDDGTKVFGGIEVPEQNFEITTTDILGAQKDERKTFEATNKGVKNFQQLLDAAKAADGAASYALMIKFIKQLDDSVVREGEVATFGGFQGALTNLKNQISKTSGEGFTPKVKANMINLAAQTANRLVNDYNIYKAGKEASYDAIGFDPNMIFAGLDFNLGDLDLSRQYTPSDFEFIEYE